MLGDLVDDGTYEVGAQPEPPEEVQRALDPVRAPLPAAAWSDLLVRALWSEPAFNRSQGRRRKRQTRGAHRHPRHEQVSSHLPSRVVSGVSARNR
jgi:hypothetical protein